MSENIEQKDRREGKLWLMDLVNKSAEEFLGENRFLDRLEVGEVTTEVWREFAVQRYAAAMPFEGLLEACKVKAEEMGDEKLTQVLLDNLRDEAGVDEAGQVVPELAHSTWRQNFYQGLGLSEVSLATIDETGGTRSYREALEELIETGDMLQLAGAILVLEGSIPREFLRLKRGRDVVFPGLSAEARLYLDDHILHDAKSHYPDLLGALEKYAKMIVGQKKITEGVRVIAEAKKKFYQDGKWNSLW